MEDSNTNHNVILDLDSHVEEYSEKNILTSFLEEIFHKTSSDNKFTKLIKTTNKIPSLLEFLFSKSRCLEKIQLINYLNFNFKQLPHNIEIFSRYSISIDHYDYNLSLIHVLIDLYLRESHLEKEDTPEDIQLLEMTIRLCLEEMINHVDCKKEIFEYVFQGLAKYYRDEGEGILTTRLLMKYLTILKIIYGEKLCVAKPGNYFYFSGEGGIKVNENSLGESKVKLSRGCVISIWFKIEIEPEELEEMNSRHQADLFTVVTSGGNQEIKVYLLEGNKVYLSNYSEKDYISILPAREWVSLSLMIKPKTFMRSPEFVVYINNESPKKYMISNFNCDTDITSISFFNNFIGQVTSIMYLSSAIPDDHVTILSSYTEGISKDSRLYHFMKSGNEKYMSYSNNPHASQFFSLKNIDAYTSVLDNLKFFYTPICSTNMEIEDICENYHAYFDQLSLDLNGVHIYHCYMKNIYLLGGINNLLPIAELLHSSVQLEKSYKLLTPVLDQDTFLSFLEMITIILSYRKKNMKDAVHRNFFQLLCLFIEKFPTSVFNEKILESLLILGKSLFSMVDHCKLSSIFFDNILLNEKIFSKFSVTIQAQLWNSLYQFYVSDVSQVKSFMSMSKICLLLRYYDETRYMEYCCNDHAIVFNHIDTQTSLRSMNPEMKYKIANLIQIIQFMIDNNEADKSDDAVTLFKMLSLDLSPCLQKFIVTIFLNYFLNIKIPNDKKCKTLSKLINHNCLDIALYVLSISLLDIRCEIIKLFSVISKSHSSISDLLKNLQHCEEKIFLFVQDYVLPLNLLTYKPGCKNENIVRSNSSSISISSEYSNYSQSLRPMKKKYAGQSSLKRTSQPLCVLNVIDETQEHDKSQQGNPFKLTAITPTAKKKENQNLPSKSKILTRGFSDVRRSLQLENTPSLSKMILDIDTINNDKDKDEEDSKNLHRKIKLLAKHCVDCIEGRESKAECMKHELEYNTFANNSQVKRFSKGLTIGTTSECERNVSFCPKTDNVGKVVIIFNEPKINNEVIEEEPCEMNSINAINTSFSSSSAKKKENAGQKVIESSQLEKVKVKLDFAQQQGNTAAALNKTKSMFIREDDSVSPDEMIALLCNTESLHLHFNEEIFNCQLDIMYNTLFLWMVNKKEPQADTSSDLGSIYYSNSIIYLDNKDFISNPPVLDILIKLVSKCDMIYIHKLIQDIHLLILNNKENCFILYKNFNFYHWLVETLFKCFQMRSDDFICNISNKRLSNRKGISCEILEMGKKIHTEIITTSIIKEEVLRSEPMNKLNYLLTWGLYYKCIYDHNRKISYEVNDFIRLLFEDILTYLKDRALSLSLTSPPSVSSSLWENYAAFASLSYEFMTFYNLDKTIKVNSISFLEPNCDTIIVPTCLFSGLNLDPMTPVKDEKKKDCVTKLWMDSSIFETIYSSFSRLWSFQNIAKHTCTPPNFSWDSTSTSTLIPIYEKIVEDLIINKKKKDIFIEDFKLLTFIFKPEGFTTVYDLPLMKVISNLFTITITLIQDEAEVSFWFEEYQQFLSYLIIASTNMITIPNDFFNKVQDMCFDVIAFGLCFLNDEYINTKKNKSISKYYAVCIKNIFILISLILEYAHMQTEKRKNKISILSLLNKNKKHDLTKCAVYKIFNEFVFDKSGNQLLTAKKINEMKMTQFIDIPVLFGKDVWKQGLTENPLLKKKLRKLFDFATYEAICKERYEKIKMVVPVYENIISQGNNVNVNVNAEQLNLRLSPVNLDSNLKLKNAVHKIIENLIPFYEKEFQKYSNNSFFGQKTKRNTYKLVKKKLFSWRGFWSDKDIFFNHPEKLKLKMLNHYTSHLSRPLLIPILDMNYYLPEFTHYKPDYLFIQNSNEKNTNSYKLNLDIDDILNSNDNDTELDINLNSNDNNILTNYIKDIYQLTNPIIWKCYSKISDKINFSKDAEFMDLLNKYRVTSSDPNLKKLENYYECCFVKPSHHIKGIFYINKNGVTFRVFLNQIKGNNYISSSENDIKSSKEDNKRMSDDFDADRNTCFGSYFVYHHKDKDTFTFDFPYNEIKFIFKRHYYYRKSAIEMFSVKNKSYYFNFKSVGDREKVIKEILAHLEIKREIRVDTKEREKEENLIIGYENLTHFYLTSAGRRNTKSEYVSNKIDAWANWKMSNFELLMWLNTFANRSYSDLSQYPVFPWILSNYSSDHIDLESDIRNFSLPMGMMDLDERGLERKNLYIETYNTIQSEPDESGAVPYCYGSHYSNPMYVSHYLTRIFPFSHIMIELQGDKFDDPNRLFCSIANSFDCATTQKGDVRELLPEFYYLPEMFININNLNMGYRTDLYQEKSQVTNVVIPSWANNDPYEFVIKMKDILESEEVSQGICEWIDLVFGYKQKGKEAQSVYNLFIPSSYEDAVNIDFIEKEQRPYYLRMVEFGMTPNNLFSREYLGKYQKDHIRGGKQITESKELKYFWNSQNKQKWVKDKPVMLKLKVLDNDKVMCVFNNNTYSLYKFAPGSIDAKLIMDSNLRIYITPDNVFKIHGKMKRFYTNSLTSPPIIVYNNGRVIAQGGYWDGRITISYQEGSVTRLYNLYTDLDSNPVVVLEIDKDERLAFSGTTIGTINIYKVNDHKWDYPSRIFHHSDEITSIAISNTLNMWASSSLDCYVNLYTLPSNRMVRSIRMKGNNTADYVFLSSSPLPSFVIYSKTSKMFYCYSINGCLLCEVFEDSWDIISPVIFTDITFSDFLICGTANGALKIRKFPYMSCHYEMSLLDHKPLKCLDISDDKRFCYVWILDGQDVILIKDPSATSEAATMNLIQMGFASY